MAAEALSKEAINWSRDTSRNRLRDLMERTFSKRDRMGLAR
jgi:hypothetical protein